MITLHCLAHSRAIRLIWLMEDLGLPYQVVHYPRTDNFQAPEALKDVHILGKSPVMEDGTLRIAESATCLRYLVDKAGDTGHQPPVGTLDYTRHEELLDYVESSFAPACMDVMLPALSGDTPSDVVRKTLATHLNYIAQALPEAGLLFGSQAMLADIQFSYLLANLAAGGALKDAPRVQAYWDEMQKQPGYKAAIKVAGPMAPDL